MILTHHSFESTPLRHAITQAYRADETLCIDRLIQAARFSDAEWQKIHAFAQQLTLEIRKSRKKLGKLDAFLQQYDLSSEEGIALMCLAEALLRVPDTTTMDRLISDKISTASWNQYINASPSLFVNAATWSLLLTGKILTPSLNSHKSLTQTLNRWLSKAGSTIIRPIILQGMKIIGNQFVMGRTIKEGLKRAVALEKKGYRYSYDMLGEAARTAEDAKKYYQSYLLAIETIGKNGRFASPILAPGISIKLSALHPRYEFAKYERVLAELPPLLLNLILAAKHHNIGVTIDAEEADKLDLSLDIFAKVFQDVALKDWEGLGLAIQSYQKRAPFVIDWLENLTKKNQRRCMVRLIKGAYWDSEIKFSQAAGYVSYPVFTRKNATDISFIACAKKLIAKPTCFYPQFGTHNAVSVAAIIEMMKGRTDFEFQCLHGMGEPLYHQMIDKYPCRIYAPIGGHKELLGYLVRRLLENGANTSFINRIKDENLPLGEIIYNPIERIANLQYKPHPKIPLPRDIYRHPHDDLDVKRFNSLGLDLTNVDILNQFKIDLEATAQKIYTSGPIIANKLLKKDIKQAVYSPHNLSHLVGEAHLATPKDIEFALTKSMAAKEKWQVTTVDHRAAILEHAAILFEENTPTLVNLLCREGGKQIQDCLAEIRETVDFCHYYAARARIDLKPHVLQSPAGEFNQLQLYPRGIIACISPWNFPLAIFAGQILAALVTGNCVIAKPAEQTPLIAAFAVTLLQKAGLPPDVLQLLPGDGSAIGSILVADERVNGVMFTGSTATAEKIQQKLTQRGSPITPFIAETGGQNAFLVDSTALPEQVIADVILSAFNSAGQRCSAARVLFLQDDIATPFLHMLKGAMAELVVGDPGLLSTDIGPVIDQEALKMLQNHADYIKSVGKLIYEATLPPDLPSGHYFAPRAYEIDDLSFLKGEIFGPILHVIRYPEKKLSRVLDAISHAGFGLTLGIHSRIATKIKYIAERMPIGNVYVNRNMIGAVVGVQPFGGQGLSGTGPKAGGPFYLPRLCVERTLSVNTTAAGGNTTLISLSEED